MMHLEIGLPRDKVSTFEEILTQSQQAVAFVGDGVDAPVLARGDVGIGGGGLVFGKPLNQQMLY